MNIVKILIVEDDRPFASMLGKYLARNNYTPIRAHSTQEAKRLLDKEEPDLILTDVRLPDEDGLSLLETIKTIKKELPVILMTSFGQVKSAVAAMKKGAHEYITKPIDHEELLRIIEEATSSPKPTQKPTSTPSSKPDFIKGKSAAFQQTLEQAHLVAETDLSVLILGESGTGKEYLSRYIHDHSTRSDKPFVAVDCGALSKDLAGSELFGHVKGAFTGATSNKEGQFSAANTGTLFLDEIGNLSYDIQVQLLRAIEERTIRKVGDTTPQKVDVRIIAATNEPLGEQTSSENFREDLYHRINEFQIDIPPLRERSEDLMDFVEQFIQTYNQEFGRNVTSISPEAKQLIKNYRWPGNIRELKNVIRRAVLLEKSTSLSPASLPDFLSTRSALESKADLKSMKQNREITMIKETLIKTNYNKSKTARLLNIDRSTLYDKIKKYDLEVFIDQRGE
ncbi:sigma-54-dependent transcriptional regulator [Marinoscillum furvescens]|uniref:Two-component system response regulator HydG n=1 Tax=Marinoscillum furvescens DSM 4134 TaxID=1122208 RepID=A0A3D9L3R4_MARFU|nr:sigma-54 dependent transcriptional regulator [Marinoscillum furvescens]RED99840.1 two-component system response regulator HydG [Marinoscillum furvescens DSM 4134]